MNKIIYISGRITGDKEYVAKFMYAHGFLFSCHYYDKIVDPVEMDKDVGTDMPYNFYLKRDINALMECTHIYMLRGWWKSKGARCEWLIAKTLGLKIIYETKTFSYWK